MTRVWQKAGGPTPACIRRGCRLALAEFRVVRASLARIGVITTAARVKLAVQQPIQAMLAAPKSYS